MLYIFPWEKPFQLYWLHVPDGCDTDERNILKMLYGMKRENSDETVHCK